jgi:Raf kinase inhibitor-like YbhB/YbcL family protein
MKKTLLIIIPILIVIVVAVILYLDKQQTKNLTINLPEQINSTNQAKSNMQLTSEAFGHNQEIPGKYTCDGDNISPPLTISGVSERAKSLVLIVDDPDAPAGDWVHWTVWNIPVNTIELPENGPLPARATEGVTDFGKPGYGGPCPPSGTHRYFFKLYSIGGDLYLDETATKKDIEAAMEDLIIEKAELIGLYQRQ